jgi:DNA-binding XRE family transcriptional regulator
MPVPLTDTQIDKLRAEPLVGRNKVRAAMDLAEVTQVQVAEGTGHTQPYISSIINGKYTDQLPLETGRRLAGFFGCAIEDLFPARSEERQAVGQ